MTASDRSPFRWPPSIDAVWIAMPLFVVAVRTLLQPIPPEDYWWHLAMGRLIDGGALPTTNMFLYTLPVDAPFYDQPWLAQWVMYLVARGGGHVATVGLHTALLVGTWSYLVRHALTRGAIPIVVGIAAALAHYVAASTLVPRTQMFAYPCFVAVVVVLLASADGRCGRARLWVTVGVATLVWANVHGSFVLAPILVAAVMGGAILEGVRRRFRPDERRSAAGRPVSDRHLRPARP